MNKLKIKFLRQYRKLSTKNLVFVYAVTGDKKQLEAYKKYKGDNFKEDKDTKEALFFSNRFIGKVGELMETADNKWVIDTTEADQMKSLTEQYGYEMAKDLMNKTGE